MKKHILFIIALSLVFFSTNCVNKSKNNPSDKEVTQIVVSGTYQGIMPCADCPGLYVKLALGDSSYQMMKKYLYRDGYFISEGHLKLQDDTLQLMEDRINLEIIAEQLVNGNWIFEKENADTMLPDYLTTRILYENETGQRCNLKLYAIGDQQFADLTINGKDYHFKRDSSDWKQESYKNEGSASTLIFDKQKPDVSMISLLDGDNYFSFIELSPIDVYYAMKKSGNTNYGTLDSLDLQAFDVLYCNTLGANVAVLLNTNLNYCRTLPRVDAAAKSAEYRTDSLSWVTKPDGNASIMIGKQQFSYQETK